MTSAILKSALQVSLATLLLTLTTPAALRGEDYSYTTNNGTITITGYAGPGGAITIPDTLTGRPVTAIGDAAFWQKTSLTSVSLPATVTTIGVNAFALCKNLTAVEIPNSVTSIGGAAFYTTGLSNVVIPDSVRALGGQLFESCTALRSVTLGHGITNLPDTAFRICSSLSSITIPANVLSLSVETFAHCIALTNVTLVNGLRSVGAYSFEDCPLLPSLTLPATVTNIGYGAFIQCTSLAAMAIPDSVTTLGSCAFLGCQRLCSVTLPIGVTTLGDATFYQCAGLTNLVLPNTLTSIGNNAFSECSSLAAINLPASVTSIGPWAFYLDYRLTAINVDPLNPNYSSLDGVLYDHNRLSLLVCPPGKSGALSVANGVWGIADAACCNCPNLTSVTLPASVNFIGWKSFAECSHLQALYCMGPPPSTDYVTPFTNSCNVTVYYLPDVPGWPPYLAMRPTAPWYPTLQTPLPGCAGTTNPFGFNICWGSGKSVIVEASTNLTGPVWLALQTNTIADGACWFADPDWAQYPRRFYRVRAP